MSGSPLSRRTALRVAGLTGALGAAGAAVLGGCDLRPGGSSTPAAAPPPDPDQRIVDAARRELSGLVLRLSATTGASALVAVHRVQLRALGGDLPPTTQRSRALTHPQLVAHEQRAADRFAHWAETCGNGDLARLLASVAAGIRMQPVLQKAPA